MEIAKKYSGKQLTESNLIANETYKIFDLLGEGIQVIDENWRYVYVNAAATMHLRNDKKDLLGHTMMEKYPGPELAKFFAIIQICISERSAKQFEYQFFYPDKSRQWLNFKVEPIGKGIVILSEDIEVVKESELKLKKAINLNSFISQVNQNIVRVKDQTGLFRNSCKIAIEYGKFKMAWIGLFNFKNNDIHLVDHCGIPDEEMDQFEKSPYQNNTPHEFVLENNTYFICNDIENDCELKIRRPFAKKYGIRSFIVLPIRKEEKVIGTFNLYSSEINFMKKEEIALLVELTGDISYALDRFEKSKRHREVKKMLSQNEKRYRALIEKSADMITLTKEHGDLIYCSSSVTKVLGYSLDELTDKPDNEFIHPNDLPAFSKHIKALISKPGESFSNQQRLRHKNGNYIWCEGTVTNMLHEPGINAMVSNFRDISERKLAERRLKKSEEFNLGILNSLSSHIAVVDATGSIVAVNENWKQYALKNDPTGLGNTGIGSNYFNICAGSAEDGEKLADVALNGMKDVMNSKRKNFYLEYPCHSPVQKQWFGMRVIKFDSNEPMLVVAHQDISERKLAEENVARSEGRLTEAQSLAQLGNWEINFATNETSLSEEACKIYGLLPGENIQTVTRWESFVHPDDVETVTKTNQLALKTLSEIVLNYRIILEDGTLKHLYLKSRFELDPNGEAIGLYGIVQDVTERKLAEQEREKMIGDIVQHSKNLEQFTYIVSHNLRAPIANILGLACLLKSNISAEDREKSEKYILVAVERLDEIVQDLNKVLQIRSGIIENRVTVNLSDLVRNIELSIQNLLQKDNARIICNFKAINEIKTLKSYIHSIFFNLISNSIKYRQIDTDPIIIIKSEVVNEKVRISFKDNGVGLDLKLHKGKVFGLYNRFHQNKEGKGLGLFLTKTQVEVLGGTISIDSTPGVGTEFTIELPL